MGTSLLYSQIEATRYLVENLHIIDPRRIGVWGWSYGGYTTLRILSEEKQDLFQCGIAVAPVTNWRFYGELGFIVAFQPPYGGWMVVSYR